MITASEGGKSRSLGQMMLTVGLAVAGSVFAFAIQFGGITEKLKAMDDHIKENHPPDDFRRLELERHRWMERWTSNHEKNHP